MTNKMNKWLKYPKDNIRQKTFDFDGKTITIYTISRHNKQGRHQGFIVRITDNTGLNITKFKHYHHRSVVETYIEVMYKMGNIDVA